MGGLIIGCIFLFTGRRLCDWGAFNLFVPEMPLIAREDPCPLLSLVTSSVLMVKDNFVR